MKHPKGMIVTNVPIDIPLWKQVKQLADKYGVSASFVVRRALVYAVEHGTVYWPTDGDDEKRNNEKFGTATPLYGGESDIQVKGSESGRKAPANPAP